MSDLAAVITALAVLITAIGTWRDIKKVGKEVNTINSQTMAQLADANESRRIGKIPVKKRTALEKSHIKDVGRK